MVKNLLIGLIFGFVKLASASDYQKIELKQIPNWDTLNFEKSLETFKKSCHLKPNSSAKDLEHLCQLAKTIKPREAKVFFEQHFKAYQLQDGQDTLMTAYYAPMFEGRLSPSVTYRFPIYAKPKDLLVMNFKSLFPFLKPWRFIGRFRYGFFLTYPSRRDIMEQGLNGKAEVIAWLKDPLDVLELEIQGSGAIKTPKKVLYINYAAQNGHQYQPIGKFLIQDGKIPKELMSIGAIRDYFKLYPEELKHYLYLNPSYVFFKAENNPNFYGYHDTALTPGYSLAVDPKFFPIGMPFFISTTLPNHERFERLMIAQDTGGAIKGLHHFDLYLGEGQYAQENARKMQAKGQYWLLLPKKAATLL